MELPRIDLSDLPGLESATGLFGTLSDLATAQSDDRIIILMVWLYEVMPPQGLL
ncbi:hypothetical protein U4960_07495 [Altererythrobacter sp. H2]|uniref:hypothetical protein n=1 Tax=Altererythrobacter sp. H2 TaxID=3108391 RepID=UPI002B4C0005|nr:hypothetical protein [Altererythrobacter sp. H2]WRK97150.1 hypothetical protein U4960_07495 [Altererythrobacter sp. H2]